MSGSSLDGLDIVFTELEENAGKWSFQIQASTCFSYNKEWPQKLQHAKDLHAREYLLLHNEYGEWLGEKINEFITANNLEYKVQLIASHGHTVFHAPEKKMTAQLGNGAVIAAITGINVVSELRALDIAFGGQGAPIVPMGEKLLWNDVDYFLNIGGIANLSCQNANEFIAFDVCPANRILNMLAQEVGKEYDEDGNMAASGNINQNLLDELNSLDYYRQSYPKSLANEFGTDIIFPIIQSYPLSISDALRTYSEHITIQIVNAFTNCQLPRLPARMTWSDGNDAVGQATANCQLMITGGGAFNAFLIERVKILLDDLRIDIVVSSDEIIKYKEALIMALLGVLRWREEYTVMKSVTGATRNSIGGVVWMGQEA